MTVALSEQPKQMVLMVAASVVMKICYTYCLVWQSFGYQNSLSSDEGGD